VQVNVNFYSYLKDLTGCAQVTETLPDDSTLDTLFQQLTTRFPKLGPVRKSILMAVGLDYQDRKYRLKEGDDVSLFPPVQGG